MRTCTRCKSEKPVTEFYTKDKTGRLTASCKACHNESVKKWQNENREKVRGYVRKSCKKAYDADPEKHKEKSSKRRLSDPEAHKARVRRSYAKMQACPTEKEIARRKRNARNWRANNLEKVRAIGAEWRKRNPSKHCARQGKRRAGIATATPEWLTAIHNAQLLECYDIAKARSVQTGIAYEVDHIHPLKGDNVCGLHVPWNLQVITAAENRAKSNKIIDDESKP